MSNTETVYPAIHLHRQGNHVVVSIEVNKKWVEVIRELHDSPFSHIVEPAGIQVAIDKSKTKKP